MGEAHLRTHDTEKAIEVLLRAEQLCDDLGDKLHLADVKRALAKAYLERGDLKAARDSIKRSVDLFGQVRSKPIWRFALRTLGEVTGRRRLGRRSRGESRRLLHAFDRHLQGNRQ